MDSGQIRWNAAKSDEIWIIKTGRWNNVLRELLILQVKHVSYDWILKKKLSQKHSGNDMADNSFFLVSD